MANALGKPQEGRRWQSQADRLLRAMLDKMWKGDHFVALHDGDHKIIESQSLLMFLPLILGKQLPQEIRSKLIQHLKEPQNFLSIYGLATESLRSPYYTTNGYWLGPMWAPPTMLRSR